MVEEGIEDTNSEESDEKSISITKEEAFRESINEGILPDIPESSYFEQHRKEMETKQNAILEGRKRRRKGTAEHADYMNDIDQIFSVLSD